MMIELQGGPHDGKRIEISDDYSATIWLGHFTTMYTCPDGAVYQFRAGDQPWSFNAVPIFRFDPDAPLVLAPTTWRDRPPLL